MLSKLIIKLEKKDGLNQNIGSLLQGVIMEKLETEYIEKLHSSELNPYSQNVIFYEAYIQWTICTMTKEAREKIAIRLLSDSEQTITLDYKKISLKILSKELQEISYEELMNQTYFGKCSPYLNLSFESPNAFKVMGRYQNYPTLIHVFQSLIRKYDAVSGETKIFSEELMGEIEAHAYIKHYNLHSTFFHLEGTKIPAFRGTITVKLNGPQMFINLMHLLAMFGEYSGVGIKSSIGMGRLSVKNKERV